MKYFKHLSDKVADALHEIFFQNRQADKTIEFYFKNHKKWGKRDRHFFAENIYGVVRWWNQLVVLANASDLSPLEQCHRVLAAHLVVQGLPLPEWYETFFTPEDVLSRKNKLTQPHLIHAIPQWLEDLGAEELSTEWSPTMTALNQTAKVVLRTNTEKTTPEELQNLLAQENIQTDRPNAILYPEALVFRERANVFRTQAFEKGLFEVQDASSQRVAHALAPQPGERIIDACAGAGGKSLHMAALMKSKGRIISMDIYESKLQELKKRARRAGTSLIEPRVIEGTKTIKRLDESCDALLLDVPCSGLGVLKRNPDSKWKLSLEKIQTLRETQQHILSSYTRMVKPKGRCVYATCSVLPSENQHQVQTFLKNNPTWTLVHEEIILPQKFGFDGFYLARLQKT